MKTLNGREQNIHRILTINLLLLDTKRDMKTDGIAENILFAY
jgi:hypothetical protein